jgi:transposase
VNKRFRVCSHDQPFLLPPSLQDWLPENHLARFIAEVINELDLSSIYASYERRDGRGLAAYHPALMTRLLLYSYCIGITSSRKIEQATYDNVAFRYLSADQHPDHDTLAAFRQEHLQTLADLFVQALRLCQKAGLVKLGNVSIDGTKEFQDKSFRTDEITPGEFQGSFRTDEMGVSNRRNYPRRLRPINRYSQKLSPFQERGRSLCFCKVAGSVRTGRRIK